MDWTKLLTPFRPGADPSPTAAHRLPYEIDTDRIERSRAFARLNGKTQVHGRGGTDHTRTRLLHSLEAGRIGRSIAAIIGPVIADRHCNGSATAARDVMSITYAACVAHDLGTSCFGHVGERIVSGWFRTDGRTLIADLPEDRKADFLTHDSNAETFRLMTSADGRRRTGLELTAATIAAAIKYPNTAAAAAAGINGKYAVFYDDVPAWEAVANACSLPKLGPGLWARAPLSWVSEAADDAAYLVADIEDGVHLGLLTASEGLDALATLVSHAPVQQRGTGDTLDSMASAAIETLIVHAATTYLDNEPRVLDTSWSTPLLDASPLADAIARIRALARDRLYHSRPRTYNDLAAERTVRTLLRAFSTALADYESSGDAMSPRSAAIIRLLPDRCRVRAPRHLWLREMVAYIVGCTDAFSEHLAQQLA